MMIRMPLSKRASNVLLGIGLQNDLDLMQEIRSLGFSQFRIHILKIPGCGRGTTNEIMDHASDYAFRMLDYHHD